MKFKDNTSQSVLSFDHNVLDMSIKKRALDGNLERILEKIISVKLSLDQNFLDMLLKITT